MSNEPTIAQKISALTAVGKTEQEVRAIAKTIRSFSKLNALVTELQVALQAAQSVPSNQVAKKSKKLKASTGPGSVKGFRFGKVWTLHVVAVSPLVLRPAKLEKLVATAKFHGVKVSPNAGSLKIAQAISQKLSIAA